MKRLMPRTRTLLSLLPNDRPLLGAEVGVLRGRNAAALLRRRPKLMLIAVDPWCYHRPGSPYAATGDNNARHAPGKWEQLHRQFRKKTAPFRERVREMRMTSTQAAMLIVPGSLDYAFIDAEHSYDAVKWDIATWLPCVRRAAHSFIGGHDYHHLKFPGVKRAVDKAFGDRVQTGPGLVWWVSLSKEEYPRE